MRSTTFTRSSRVREITTSKYGYVSSSFLKTVIPDPEIFHPDLRFLFLNYDPDPGGHVNDESPGSYLDISVAIELLLCQKHVGNGFFIRYFLLSTTYCFCLRKDPDPGGPKNIRILNTVSNIYKIVYFTFLKLSWSLIKL
jgi:hypothetical protein